MFFTWDDKMDDASLVVQPKPFPTHRRVMPSGLMIAVCGRIQRDGRTVPLVVHQTPDHSGDLASIGKRNRALSLPDDLKDEMQQASPAEAGEPQGVPDARRLRDCIGA
ncbi:hypothetical protein [Paracoccus sp. T5]|uniref:hypothetical protein n=1 Tax=Paracoccus sp. T5 TaxID=3402161 RepID=UPI003AEC2661